MKRGFGGIPFGRVLMVVLCLSLFLSGALAAEPRKAAVIYVDNESWDANLIGSDASAGARVRATNCMIGVPGDSIVFSERGSAVVYDFARNLCGSAVAGVAQLDVEGDVTLTTDAIYRDNRGNFNTVELRELTPALTPVKGTASFSRVENNATKRADFVFFADEPTQLTITVFDNAANAIGTETVLATAFTWYELKTQVEIGCVDVRFGLPGLPPGHEIKTRVYAIGLIARREGGSPRVAYAR